LQTHCLLRPRPFVIDVFKDGHLPHPGSHNRSQVSNRHGRDAPQWIFSKVHKDHVRFTRWRRKMDFPTKSWSLDKEMEFPSESSTLSAKAQNFSDAAFSNMWRGPRWPQTAIAPLSISTDEPKRRVAGSLLKSLASRFHSFESLSLTKTQADPAVDSMLTESLPLQSASPCGVSRSQSFHHESQAPSTAQIPKWEQ
jgi:hypothetical protein